MRFPGWQSLRRNWLVAILGLMCSIGLVAGAAILVPANYVATSQMVLLPPLSQPNANYNGVINPYMGLDGLQSMAQVVANSMMGDNTASALHASGVSSYSVTFDTLSAGPILLVQATEPTASQASHAITALDNQVPLTVARLQKAASISPRSYINAKVIASPSTPAQSIKTQLRAEVLALIIGLVLTLLAISIIDGWRIRRSQGSPGPHSYERVSVTPSFTEATGNILPQTQDIAGQSRTVTISGPSSNSDHQAPANESAGGSAHPEF